MPGLTRVEVNQVPKGVVGIISPWNYPFNLALIDGLPALLAGNAVVAKPDAQTMLTALLGAQLLEEAGFPADLWQVVAGPGRRSAPRSSRTPTTSASPARPPPAGGWPSSAPTGSSAARWSSAARTPSWSSATPTSRRPPRAPTRASFSNAGQLCVSTERMFVADQVYDRFVDRFVARTEAMTLGSGHDWATDMGSLISQAQLDAVIAHVEDARAKGARVLTGGRHRPDLGQFFFEPTILEGVTPDMACFGTETFGPVISIYCFHDETEAILRANEGNYGLNASVYSQDGRRARAIAREIKCGTVNINEAYAASFASIDSPMGGMRESGMGRRQGSEGVRRYTESQTVATQRGLRLSPVLGMSNETYAKVMTAQLRLMKKLGRA